MNSDTTTTVEVVRDERKGLWSISPIAVSVFVFACVFGGALLGIFIHAFLPSEYLDSDSREAVRLGMGLVGTTVAVVLGLLISSGKHFYDDQSSEVTQLAADVVLLDRLLKQYGPESEEIRDLLRGTVAYMVKATWGQESSDQTRFTLSESSEVFLIRISGLSPHNESQRFLQSEALNVGIRLGQTRSLMIAQKTSSVPGLLLTVLVFWLTLLFMSFAIWARPNVVVLGSLFASALAVSGAIFLILEVYEPYRGWVQVSSAPLRTALEHLGQ